MQPVIAGSANKSSYFQMRLTAGGDATGLTIADFDLTYTRTGDTPAAKVDAVALAAANTAHTDNRGIETDPTDSPGLYRFDFPDAAFAAGVDEVLLTVKHTSCFTETLRVTLDHLGYGGPRGPGVYLDDAAGNTNTINNVDGTRVRPVSTIAAAKTIADAMSIDRIYLVNDSAATLAATMEDFEFVGIGEMAANSINLGSQDVDNSEFWNVLITGAQGGTGRFQATGCVLSVITGMEITALSCLIANAGSLTLRDDCAFDSCFSAVAGAATPTLDINSVANVNVYFRHYSGGLTVDNAVATTVMSYEADGQIIIDATCTSLTIVVRGNCTITDNGTTTALTQDGAVNRTNINAECDTAISDAALATAANLAIVLTGTPTTKYMGPRGPGVYIDSGAANTNTVTGTDGIVGNPVSTFAAARTIADAIGVTRYYLEGNSDLALAATHVDWEFMGVGSVTDNIIDLGSQDVSRSLFLNLCLEGTQGGAGRIEAIECALRDPGAGATTLHIFALRCGFMDEIEVDTSNNNVFDSCYSLVAGATTPKIIATGASGTIEIRHYSGGIELSTLSASHNVSIEGMGQVVFTADCNVNASVSIRGLFTITDNTAGMASLTQDAVVNMLKINTEADTALTDYDGPTKAEMDTAHSTTDALITTVDTVVDAIKVVTDVLPDSGALTTLAADAASCALGIIEGAAATGTLSTTQATSDLTGYANDQLIGRILTVTSGAADGESTDITDYASASGLLTFTALTTAMANNDTFKIT